MYKFELNCLKNELENQTQTENIQNDIKTQIQELENDPIISWIS